MDEKKLRKVKFNLNNNELNYGELVNEQNGEELSRDRYGWFHGFGNCLYRDITEGQIITMFMGIVEEENTGRVYQVLPKNIEFINN